jgi:hypothetical protein
MIWRSFICAIGMVVNKTEGGPRIRLHGVLLSSAQRHTDSIVLPNFKADVDVC